MGSFDATCNENLFLEFFSLHQTPKYNSWCAVTWSEIHLVSCLSSFRHKTFDTLTSTHNTIPLIAQSFIGHCQYSMSQGVTREKDPSQFDSTTASTRSGRVLIDVEKSEQTLEVPKRDDGTGNASTRTADPAETSSLGSRIIASIGDSIVNASSAVFNFFPNQSLYTTKHSMIHTMVECARRDHQ